MIKLFKYLILGVISIGLIGAGTAAPVTPPTPETTAPCEMPIFLINKNSTVVPIGGTVEVVITDMTPPSSGPVTYTTLSSNPAVATATEPVGGSFSVTGVSRGGATVTLTGTSSCGATTKVIGVTVP